MHFTLQEIATCTNGVLSGQGQTLITSVATDSRHLVITANTLFTAIRGEQHDGHRFLGEAYSAGIRHFLVEKKPADLPGNDANVIVVQDTLAAMQTLAAAHRHKFALRTIGITGSNGKTIVKEWLNLLLADEHVIVRSPRSYNSQIGVALSVFTIDSGHTLGLFEAGISMPGEMIRLEPMIAPDIGVLTTIGAAHREFFSDEHHIAREKCALFRNCSTVVFPEDNQPATETIRATLSDKRLFSWGVSPESSLRILSSSQDGNHTHLTLGWNDATYHVSLAFIDEASVQNILCCLTTALALGYHPEKLIPRLHRLEPISMRMEILNGGNDTIIINDTWNADPNAFRIALDVLRQQAGHRHMVVILSDILQSGLPDKALYTRINQLLESHGVSRMIGIGPNIHSVREVFTVSTTFYPDTTNLLSALHEEALAGKAILVKGSRGFRMERLARALENRTHESWLEINLQALSANLNHFRSLLRPEVKIMVMVKAAGYGSGSREVSSLLEFNKVDYLAVAYADEGVILRQSGISLPIMVMNPGSAGLQQMIRYRLEPEIYSLRLLEEWIKERRESGVTEHGKIHLKIDTGMHRLGFSATETERLLGILSEAPDLEIASVFTHLAAAENPAHDAFTRQQAEELLSVVELIRKKRTEPFLVHILNTGGIERFPEYQLDMVRLGIGLYGVSSSGKSADSLIPVVRLFTRISQIRKIRQGDSVGYGRSFVAERDTTLAVIPIGYADGLRRVLSNGIGAVALNGHRAPVAGTVCMDMAMLDVTGIPCNEGDEVEVFGQSILLEEFSSWSQTIPYEILTTIGQRMRRVYVSE